MPVTTVGGVHVIDLGDGVRSDRGYWCLPEVGLGMDLSPGEHMLVAALLLPQTRNLAVLTGRRFAAAEALAEHHRMSEQ